MKIRLSERLPSIDNMNGLDTFAHGHAVATIEWKKIADAHLETVRRQEEELAATKQNLAGCEASLKLALTRAHCDRKDLEAAQLHIKELRDFIDATKVWFSTETMIGKGLHDRAESLLAKQPDTRALDKALLEAEIAALTHAYDSCKPYGIEFSYMITERIDQLAELNEE